MTSPELAAAAEEVIDTPLFQVLKSGPAIEQVDAQHGWDIPRLSFVIRAADDPDHDSLADFAQRVLRLLREYERLGGAPLSLQQGLYRDAVGPAWASARVDLESLVQRGDDGT